MKILGELDKRHNQARLIENHARNSKEEQDKELNEMQSELGRQRDTQQKTKDKMEVK